MQDVNRRTRACAAALFTAVLAGPLAAAPPAPAAASMATSAAAAAVQRLSHGRFHDFPIYVPAGTPKSFALLLSGGGWDGTAETYALALSGAGALVAGIDTAKFDAALASDGAGCVFPDGDLENLSHFVQAYFHLPTYLTPILVGAADGGALAYAALAQAPTDTFGGALSVGFCPHLPGSKAWCKGSALQVRPAVHGGQDLSPAKTLGDPWIVLQADGAATCTAGVTGKAGKTAKSRVAGKPLPGTAARSPAVNKSAAQSFVAQIPGAEFVRFKGDALPQLLPAFEKLTAKGPAVRLAPPPAELGDLPVVVVPAAPGTPASDSLAILMSGDGGWAGLDQSVAGALAAAGIPVIGLDSLRYFWTARTPAGLAADTDRMIRYYLARLGKQRALLIGYSQGADVLPFAVNRLPAATRASVGLVAIMGMSEHAVFEFHVTSWISDDDSGPATLPEVNRIVGTPVLCIYGADETDSLCPKLDPQRVRLVKMPGGHHFNGDYAGLARQILAAAR